MSGADGSAGEDRKAEQERLGAALQQIHRQVRELLEEAASTGDFSEIDESIQAIKQFSDELAPNDPGWYAYLTILGSVLSLCLEHTGSTDELEEVIDVHRKALDVAPEDDPYRAGHLSNLGLALRRRSDSNGRVKDLDEAIEVSREAVYLTSQDDYNHCGYVSNLGSALRWRYRRTGELKNLHEAVTFCRQSIASAPKDHPNRPGCLSNLGATLLDRFQRTGRVKDLLEAVDFGRQAVGLVPENHPYQSLYFNQLRAALQNCFERIGNVEDLYEAIDAGRRAIKSAPTNRYDQALYASNLTLPLRLLFEHTGRIEDLDEAIEVGCRAVQLAPEDEPNRALYLTHLGHLRLRRFERTNRLEEVDEAVSLMGQALEIVPEDHPERCGHESDIGIALEARFHRTGEVNDLNKASTFGRRAVNSAPKDHPRRPLYLNNLGLILRSQYELTSRRDHLDEALETCSQALKAVPQDDPDRCEYLLNQGATMWLKFEETKLPEDAANASQVFRSAFGVVSAPVHERAIAARCWGHTAMLARRWGEAVEGYGAAVDMAALVVSPELGRSDQEHRLRLVSGLGSEAAAACLQAGEPERAVELFEHGRAVLFSQTLDARSPLTDLEKAHPELAQRFIRWRDELNRPGARPAGVTVEDHTDLTGAEAIADRRREAAVELDRVLEEIRACSGFERFLKARTVAELLPAAAVGPVVLLNVAELRSDALILTSGGVQVVSLKEVDAREISAQTEAFLAAIAAKDAPSYETRTNAEAALTGVLGWLGERVTGPVLDHLGYTANPGKEGVWPRVWWCPSGALSLLPLHAAGHHEVHEGSSDAVIDRVISSTVPTVRALLRARESPPPAAPRMLVVAMPHTPGQPDLPGAAEEASTLRSLWLEKMQILGLPGTEEATYDTVMDALPGHPWVHFSCHGESNLNDPSSSHLVLSDYRTQPLTVLDLTAAHLHGELAFLSACTTARTGTALPDEPIHLAAACQLAGYRHVVASLWPISDRDTASLAKRFYATYAEKIDTADAVATALHHATRRLRTQHRDRPSRWAPYVHTGP